jgi:hypothetical protein
MAKSWTVKSVCVMDDYPTRDAVKFYDFSQANFCVDPRIVDPADLRGTCRTDWQ